MTTTTPDHPARPAPPARPPLRGLSHLALSVDDLDAAAAFWRDVMGLEVTGHEPGLVFLVDRDARLGLGLTDHSGAVRGTFDHLRPGLDHVALAVDGPDALDAWAARLDAHGVDRSAVVRTDAGHHLNLRAPGGVAVELFVMSAETAVAFGLGDPSEGVAHGHGAALPAAGSPG